MLFFFAPDDEFVVHFIDSRIIGYSGGELSECELDDRTWFLDFP